MKLLRAVKEGKDIDFNLPENVRELSWGQANGLVNLEQDESYTLNMVSLMTGIEPDFWRSSTDTNQFIQLAIECQAFTNDWVQHASNLTEERRNPTITIEGKTVTMPDDVGNCTVGQYQDALAYSSKWRDSYDEENHDVPETFKLYGIVFKIYLQPLISGSDYNHAEALVLDIDEVPFTDVVAWAYFFLSNQEKLNRGIKTNAQQERTVLKKPMRGFRQLLKSLAFWQR